MRFTFTRRFLLVVCLAALAVMAYILLYHDPVVLAQGDLEKKHDRLKARNSQMPSPRQVLAEMRELRAANAKRERNIKVFRENRTVQDKSTLRQEIFDAFERVNDRLGGARITYCDVQDLPDALRERGNESDQSLCFKLVGNLNVIFGFLRKLPEIHGIPEVWYMEVGLNEQGEPIFDEKGNVMFNLWMEVKP